MKADKPSQPTTRSVSVTLAVFAAIALFVLWCYWHPDSESQTPGTGIDAVSVQTYLDYDAQGKSSSPSSEARNQSDASEFSCPIRLPSDFRGTSYSQGPATESWRGYSALDCRKAAREVLLGLKEDGFQLIRAEFLDLSKEAWGCTALSQTEGTLVISLIPEKFVVSSGSTNRLVITVVRIKALDLEPFDGGGQWDS